MVTESVLTSTGFATARPPFIAEVCRKGFFISGGLESPIVDVVIRYSRIEPTEIVGHVIGVLQTAHDFETFWLQSTPPLSFLSDSPSGDKVEARGILISRCISDWGPEDTDPLRPIAWFTCRELEQARAPWAGARPRFVLAQLAGPSFAWRVGHMSHQEDLGFRLELRSSQIDLGSDSPFSISAGPRLEYDYLPEIPISTFQKVFCVKLETDIPSLDFLDDRLSADATQALDDLCILVSFLSRARVEPFDFTICTSERVKRLRKVGIGPRSSGDAETSPVSARSSRDFLRVAFPRYRSLRIEGINLRLPILQLVASYSDGRFITDKFYAAENSLAKLVALLREKGQEQPVLNRGTCSAIRRALRTGILAARGEAEGRALLKRLWPELAQRLKELGASQARDALQAILLKYCVDWQDLYPPETKKIPLFATRAQFYHDADEIEISRLTKELNRCQALIERLVLRLLGWEDLRSAPSQWSLPWLQEK